MPIYSVIKMNAQKADLVLSLLSPSQSSQEKLIVTKGMNIFHE